MKQNGYALEYVQNQTVGKSIVLLNANFLTIDAKTSTRESTSNKYTKTVKKYLFSNG